MEQTIHRGAEFDRGGEMTIMTIMTIWEVWDGKSDLDGGGSQSEV